MSCCNINYTPFFSLLVAVRPYIQKYPGHKMRIEKRYPHRAWEDQRGSSMFILLVRDSAHDNLLNFGTAKHSARSLLETCRTACGDFLPRAHGFDPRLWIPLLMDLNQLYLVARRPLQGGIHHSAPSLEEMRELIAWSQPICDTSLRISRR